MKLFLKLGFFLLPFLSFPDINNQLLESIKDGDYKTVKRLIDQGVSLNQKDSHGNTPLILAILHRDFLISRLFIDTLRSSKKKNFLFEKVSPLITALSHDPEIARLLLQEGYQKLNTAPSFGRSPLSVVLNQGKLDSAVSFIRRGATFENTNPSNAIQKKLFLWLINTLLFNTDDFISLLKKSDRPLMNAVFKGDYAEVRRLLVLQKKEALKESLPYVLLNPLMLASSRESGNYILSLLLEAGADPSQKDARGQTALSYAVRYKRQSHIRVLLDYYKAPSPESPLFGSPLFWSFITHDYDTAARLLEKGSDPNRTDIDGSTLLIYASIFGDLFFVRKLLEFGARPGTKDDDGNTALSYAKFFLSRKTVNPLYYKKIVGILEQASRR